MQSSKRLTGLQNRVPFSTYIQFIPFSYFLGGLVFLGRIKTREYKKLLPQYQTVQKCDVPTKPIFVTRKKLKLMFFGEKGIPQAPWIVYHKMVHAKTRSGKYWLIHKKWFKILDLVQKVCKHLKFQEVSRFVCGWKSFTIWFNWINGVFVMAYQTHYFGL